MYYRTLFIYTKTKNTSCSQWWTQSILKIYKKNQTEDLKEFWNSKMEVKCIKPQAQDQSNNVQINKNCNWSRDLSLSSNVRLFHSFYIKHGSTRFHVSKECFPNQIIELLRLTASPLDLKHLKNFTPQNLRNITMQQ